ncbi:MAG: xanthine dehydrogenase, partial [Alphaproteobacteria bacterium]
MKRSVLDALQAARAAHRPAALVTALDGGRQALIDGATVIGDLPVDARLRAAVECALREDRSGVIEGTDIEEAGAAGVFIHVFNPPLRMIVVGAVHIAQALVPMARLVGYEVIVVDPRRAWATEDRFPDVTLDTGWPDEALYRLAPDRRTAVVTLTHDPKLDDPALIAALRSPAFYIAALGSPRTHAKRLSRLREAGLDEAALARIHGPAGLDIGARSPAEIALSILAEAT